MNVGVAEYVCEVWLYVNDIAGAYLLGLWLPSGPTNALHLDSVTWNSLNWPVRVLVSEVLVRIITDDCRAGCDGQRGNLGSLSHILGSNLQGRISRELREKYSLFDIPYKWDMAFLVCLSGLLYIDTSDLIPRLFPLGARCCWPSTDLRLDAVRWISISWHFIFQLLSLRVKVERENRTVTVVCHSQQDHVGFGSIRELNTWQTMVKQWLTWMFFF